MKGLLSKLVVPVASEDDARATAIALRQYLPDDGEVMIVHVIEKAGGAPDKASVAQREDVAANSFEAFREELDEGVETRTMYGTDVAESVFEAADDVDASAIAFTPRGGSRWVQLLTGDVALDLVTETDRPVIVLPDADR